MSVGGSLVFVRWQTTKERALYVLICIWLCCQIKLHMKEGRNTPSLSSPHQLNHPPPPSQNSKGRYLKWSTPKVLHFFWKQIPFFHFFFWSRRSVLPPIYFQLIHLSANNRCTGFSADSVTHVGTVRLPAQVPAPYASPRKYQSVHLADLKEPYWLPIQRHKSTRGHFFSLSHTLLFCLHTRAHTHTHTHTGRTGRCWWSHRNLKQLES